MGIIWFSYFLASLIFFTFYIKDKNGEDICPIGILSILLQIAILVGAGLELAMIIKMFIRMKKDKMKEEENCTKEEKDKMKEEESCTKVLR